MTRWIAVAGGFGYAPLAPGTAGSAAAALGFLGAVALAGREGIGRSSPIPAPLFVVLYLLVVLGLIALGVWAAGHAEADFGRPDDGRIVIDEVVGQLVTLGPLLLGLPTSDFFSMSLAVVTGFVLFRLFDVWKPGAVRWAERRFEGGLGVMLDDVVAGLYAAVCLLALGGLLQGIFGGAPI